MATWPNPVVLLRRAVVPMAVLFPPLAVLKLPVVCHRVQRHRWPCCSPPVVLSKGQHSTGRLVRAGSVIQSALGASCCIGVCGVGKKRPSADGRIEAADFVAVDREATSGCIVCSARE